MIILLLFVLNWMGRRIGAKPRKYGKVKVDGCISTKSDDDDDDCDYDERGHLLLNWSVKLHCT